MELSGGFATEKDAQKTPGTIARRWILEIQMAKKREKDWRETAKAIVDKYRGTKRKKNSFNILWANTEVLRPALFNSPPKPDVRRRFRANDPLGRAVSEVLERSISYSVDAYDLAEVVRDDVLDMLLPGRGVSRVRYIPSFRQVGEPAQPEADSAEQSGDEYQEELEYEQVCCEHVDWEDFLHGPGKTWSEVCWVAFKHRLTKDETEEKFGEELADKLKFDEVKDDNLDKQENKDLQQIFKTAELWEVWDKDSKKVFFVQEGYREAVLYPKPDPKKPESTEGEPPLKFKKFFPCVRPVMAVEDSSSLIPTPLYEQYKEQAEELDRISSRINKLVNQMKVRGIYDSVLTELADLLEGEDGDLTPSENTAKLYALNGDLNKAVWMLPIDMLARVLKELYLARDQAKAAIYEITGIADIVRGETQASETLGAQQLKANFANLRLSRLQKEVQRYVRDIIRLMAEVIGEQFDVQTLAQMTGLQFPTQQQKVQAQVLLQQAAMQQQAQQQPQQPGQPMMQTPAQPVDQQKMQQAQAMAQMPSWEEIKQVLQSDFAREYRVDVETDSTVADTLNNDMAGLREVLTGLVQFWEGSGPAVISGALPIEAVKAISLSICRRAKLGLEVEDAIEKMKQPTPQPAGGDDGAAQRVKLAEQQAQEKGQRAEEDAKRQVEHIEKKSKLEVAEIALKAKEAAFEKEVRAQQDALALRDEHSQRMASLDSREAEMHLKDQAREALGGLEKQVSIADERGKAAKDLSSTSQSHATVLQDAVKELVKAQGHAQKTLDSIAKEVGKKRSRQVTTPDGRKYVSEEM